MRLTAKQREWILKEFRAGNTSFHILAELPNEKATYGGVEEVIRSHIRKLEAQLKKVKR